MVSDALVLDVDASVPALLRARLAAYADDEQVTVLDRAVAGRALLDRVARDGDGAAATRMVAGAAVAAAPATTVAVRAWPGERALPTQPTVWLVREPAALVALPLASVPRAAWLSMDAEPWQLLAAARAVRDGLLVLAPEAIRRGASRRTRDRGGTAPDERTSGGATEGAPLTERELEVLRAIAEGLGNKQVAARLGISASTVKSHLEAIYAKLGAHTRSEAVSRGLRAGLVPL